MEHDSKKCGLACGWAYGCTIALVAAIVIVRAKHHWNPFVLDTAETMATAMSFCAISIQVFLPRLCLRRSGMWSHPHRIAIFCLQSVSAKANEMFDNPGSLGRLVLPSCTKHISATDSSHQPKHGCLEQHLVTWLVLSTSSRCCGISLQ